ncbi:MAG: tripartite tricarboxylate transporter TctB family protein [Spirochaetaceae bacterium]
MRLYVEKLITGFIVIILSVSMYILASTQIKAETLAGVSPQAVPHLVAKIIFLMGIIMIGQSIHLFFKEKTSKKISYSKAKFIKFPFIVFLLMLTYAGLMFYVGYFIASFIVLPTIMYVMKERKLTNYFVIAGIIIFIYIVIDVLLNIRLPKLGLFGII